MKIDPTMRVLMWLCTEKRVHANLSQTEMSERIQELGGKVQGPGTLSRFERGERWLNASRPVLLAYAQSCNMDSSAELWDEAMRITRRLEAAESLEYERIVADPARDWADALDRVARLRDLAKPPKRRQ